MSVKPFLFKLTFLFCLFFLAGNALFADQKPKNYDAIIHTSTDHRYKGLLLDVSDKGITIDFLGKQQFFSADSISSIKIKRTGSRKKHSLVGAGVGLVAGIPIYIDGNNKGKLSSLALPVVVVATSVSGILVGSLVNSITAVQRFDNINKETSFKSIQPVLLRYSQASPTRVPAE